MKIDWIAKLRHLLQALAFCLAVATIQYAFQPERPYGPPVVYSLFIGTIIWAVIDLGRHLFPSSAETGWPHGLGRPGRWWSGGIVAGYLLGNSIGGHAVPVLRPVSARRRAPTRRRNCAPRILITVLAGIAGSFYFYSSNKSAYLRAQDGRGARSTPTRRG